MNTARSWTGCALLRVAFVLTLPSLTLASGELVFEDTFSGPAITATGPAPGFSDLQAQTGLPSGANTFGARDLTALFGADDGAATISIDGSGVLEFSIGPGVPFSGPSPGAFANANVRWAGFPTPDLNFPYPEVEPEGRRLLEIDLLELSFRSVDGQPLDEGSLTVLLLSTTIEPGSTTTRVIGRHTIADPVLAPTTIVIPLKEHLREIVDEFSLAFSTMEREIITARVDAVRVVLVPEPAAGVLLLAAVASMTWRRQ